MSPARFLWPARPGAVIVTVFLGALPLGGCGVLSAGGEADTGRPPSVPMVAARAASSDVVPAPAVFEATGTARWDGRQTLQGVWVAHPRASAARRVRIYNAATGAAADGALFTRDPVLSGPSMLVSSDAANLLGLAPGEEAELRVVAVMPRPTGGEAAAEGVAETVAGAAAATPRAADPAADRQQSAADAGPTVPPPAAVAAPAAVAVQQRAVAESAAPRAAGTRAGEPSSGRAAAGMEARAEPRRHAVGAAMAAAAPRPQPSARGLRQTQVEDGSQAEPALARQTAPLMPASRGVAPGSADARTAAAAGESGAPGPSALEQPYVQAGVFAVKGNAERLIRRIEAEGLPAEGRPVRLATGTAIRVLAGPFATAGERDAALRRIQAMGLPDTVPVAR